MSKLPIVAIVGRANVGKSSIFNRFLDRREAIVADEPGTTRDAIHARVSHGLTHFWAVDTAGLKAADDDFELTIQEQILEATHAADVMVVVVEAGAGISDEDRRVAKMALKSKKDVILAINKADNPGQVDVFEYERLGIKTMLLTSAAHNRGIDELLDVISKKIPKKKDDSDPNTLSLSFIGRPNVGKSSLFNSLLAKQKAVVADVAGTTRDVNRHEVKYHEQTVELLDTAGIRRSGKIGTGIEHFSVLRALQAIEDSDVCCMVMDANELNTKLDQKIAGMIKEAGKGLIIVVSKWDTIDKDPFTRDQLAATITHSFPFIAWAPLIFTSSVTGQNVTKLFDLAFTIKKTRETKVSTSELNQWLRDVKRHHPPAGLKNKHPNLNYMTQVDSSPPRFKIFGRDVKYLHWSYKRYMEKNMREKIDFAGTPIEFVFVNNSGKEQDNQEYGN